MQRAVYLISGIPGAGKTTAEEILRRAPEAETA